MPNATRKYARIYYDDLEREFPSVYRDDVQLATWVRLLIHEERVWPAIPELPRTAVAKTIAALVTIGLVIRVGAYGYRVRGLDADRSRRLRASQAGSAARWGANADANADATGHANGHAIGDATGRAEGRAFADAAARENRDA